MGGNRSTERKPTKTQGDHAISPWKLSGHFLLGGDSADHCTTELTWTDDNEFTFDCNDLDLVYSCPEIDQLVISMKCEIELYVIWTKMEVHVVSIGFVP